MMSHKTYQDIDDYFGKQVDKTACVICKVPNSRLVGMYICDPCSDIWKNLRRKSGGPTFIDWTFSEIEKRENSSSPIQPPEAMGIPQRCIRCGRFNEYQAGPYTCYSCK